MAAITSLSLALLPCFGIAELHSAFDEVKYFNVEIAISAQEQARGLMERENLSEDEGMLFLYDDEAPRSFWMKNTPLALDIYYFDKKGLLINKVDGEPYEETPVRSHEPAQYVLEVPAKNEDFLADTTLIFSVDDNADCAIKN